MGQQSEPSQSPDVESAPLICPSLQYLDDDPDTSLVESLRLHLVSEHAIGQAITSAVGGLDRLHRQLHLTAEATHLQNDLRFRPGRVMRSLADPSPRRSNADAIT